LILDMFRREMYAIALLVFVSSSVRSASETVSPEVTNWPDEREMRSRMAIYAKEKFALDYHRWNDSSAVHSNRIKPVKADFAGGFRSKRDGGIVSGPIATAVVTGMIGMTARAVQDLANFQVQMSQGGCSWFGTAPLCNYPCPAEYDYIRPSNGRCSDWWLAGVCIPDDSFGKPCSNVLGHYFYKRFCCKSDPAECSWSGRWMGANTAHNIYCRYDNNVGKCGSLDCSINHFTLKATNSSDIYGDRCDKINLFGLKGKATCGYIAWYDELGEVVNSWYKTRMYHTGARRERMESMRTRSISNTVLLLIPFSRCGSLAVPTIISLSKLPILPRSMRQAEFVRTRSLYYLMRDA
ncbi:hypothetical protein PFISCL1PPCAC_17574, partial [Pristionchus fissidentatus]